MGLESDLRHPRRTRCIKTAPIHDRIHGPPTGEMSWVHARRKRYMETLRFIDGDSHILEPERIWQDYLEKNTSI